MTYTKLLYCRKNLLCLKVIWFFYHFKYESPINVLWIVIVNWQKSCVNYYSCNFGRRSWTHRSGLYKKRNCYSGYCYSTLDSCISSYSVPLHVDNTHRLFGLANNRCIYPLQEVDIRANTLPNLKGQVFV